jgi:hypothetical protein
MLTNAATARCRFAAASLIISRSVSVTSEPPSPEGLCTDLLPRSRARNRTIDCEEDRVLRAVRAGMLREAARNSLPHDEIREGPREVEAWR